MQNVDYIPQTRTHYDPAQRAAQWKQRVVREEDTLANGVAPPLSARSQAAGQRGSAGISDVLPGPGSTLGRLPSSRRPDIPELTQIRDGLRSSRSSMASSRSSRYTGRSTARSGASELSTFRSIGSNCSNLTEVALGRIERLEASLEEEKRRRAQAEKEISQLRALVTSGGSTARSGRSSMRSARSGRSTVRSQR